jgi:hypothetical protein
VTSSPIARRTLPVPGRLMTDGREGGVLMRGMNYSPLKT